MKDALESKSLVRRVFNSMPEMRPATYFYAVVALLLIVQALFESEEIPASLLILLSSSIIAAILLNGVFSWFALRRIDAKVTMPPTVFAGEKFDLQVEILNRRTLTGSPSLNINVRGGRGFHERLGVYLASYVAAGSSEIVETRALFLRRGTQRLRSVRLSTGFPFGLVRTVREIVARNRIVVFPRSLPLPPVVYQRLLMGGKRGKGEARQRGGSDEIYGLRKYVDGDSLSHLHWRTTARVGKPMVVMHDDQRERDYRIVIDTWTPDGGHIERQSLERLVSLAAGALNFLHQRGARVGFRYAKPEVFVERESRGLVSRHKVLTELADLSYSDSPISEWSRRAFEGLRRDDQVLLFTLSPPDAIAGVVSTATVPVEVISIQDAMILTHLRNLGRYSLRQDSEETKNLMPQEIDGATG